MNHRKHGKAEKAIQEEQPGNARTDMKAKKARSSPTEYTIKDLSDNLEVSVKTLKNWEQKNLIPKARRSVFGWRIYTQAELDKTEAIVRKNNFFNKNQNGK